MAYAQDAMPPARRRVALRTVPPPPHYLQAEPVARLVAPAEEQSFLETLRKLWRHRLLIAACLSANELVASKPTWWNTANMLRLVGSTWAVRLRKPTSRAATTSHSSSTVAIPRP